MTWPNSTDTQIPFAIARMRGLDHATVVHNVAGAPERPTRDSAVQQEKKMSVPPVTPGELLSPDRGPVDEPLTWRWLFADQAGIVMTEPDVAFDSQEAAEDWLRDEFEELAEEGIATVTLMDGEHAVYGPMYLTPDGGGAVAEAEI